LENVIVTSNGVSFSSDAIQACVEQGIPIHFLDPLGRPYAALYSAGLTGTVLTRREQMAAYHDARGVALAKAFAEGKIRNQNTTLKYLAKNYKEKDPDLFQSLRLLAGEVLDHLAELDRLQGDRVDDVRAAILSAEGRAAQKYWEGVRQALRQDLDWPGRRTRGAKDPLNSALNYGYGVLYGQVERALILAGLDPYGGYLHVDRPGKPSLVLDLIEEFRQAVVDRTVIGMVNKGIAIQQEEDGGLTRETRRDLAVRVLERLEAAVRYEKKQHPLKHVLQMQARHLATYIRRERETYVPFVCSW
ncbi:MAG: CRISPR-associated endonuclease Cas1, partial [Anaerolineae bacterium]